MTGTPGTDLVCPLCAGANACRPARSGTFAEPCWCETASFDAALLDRVPPPLRGASCICAACAGAASAAQDRSAPAAP